MENGSTGVMASMKKAAYVRLATKADVPITKRLIEGLAEFKKQLNQCCTTESALESTLFRHPAFLGPTVLLLELASSSPHSNCPSQSRPSSPSTNDSFQEKWQEVSLFVGLEDPTSSTFVSAKDASRVVVGFVLCLPNYASFWAKPGLFIEDLYVREAYRRQGLGSVLLKAVAQQAAKRGLGRVESGVLDWNVHAIKFYESMGAVVHNEYKNCRLTGDALQAFAA